MLRVLGLIIFIAGIVGTWFLVLPRGDAEKDFALSNFNSVHISDGIWGKIYISENHGVRVRVLRGELDNIVLERRGGTLNVSVDQTEGFFGPWARNRYQVTIWMPSVSKVVTDNDASVEIVSGIIGDLEAQSHNESNLLVSEIIGTTVSATATEGGSLTIMGVCNHLRAYAETKGSVSANGLECISATADARSDGEIEARAYEQADLSALGGRIEIYGGAEITRKRALLGGEIVRR